MSKHTPGPWEWRDADDLRQAKSTRDDGRYGAQVIGAGYDYDRGAYLDMTDADRDLIAAAPDMLAELRTLLRVHQRKAQRHLERKHKEASAAAQAHADRIAALIARATGEP